MIRCITGVKNWVSTLDKNFSLDILMSAVLYAHKEDMNMSSERQEMKDIRRGFFAGFFSFFIRVCPPLL